MHPGGKQKPSPRRHNGPEIGQGEGTNYHYLGENEFNAQNVNYGIEGGNQLMTVAPNTHMGKPLVSLTLKQSNTPSSFN